MTSPFRTTPQLGPNLHQVVTANDSWYDNGEASPQLGTVEFGDDGFEYMWVEASGTIADAADPGTQVTLTVTAPDNVTAATGSGGWYAPFAANYGTDILAGDRFWARKGTAP